MSSRACLESLPGVVDHRPGRDGEDGTDRGLDARRGVGHEPRSVGLDAHLDPRSPGRSAHEVDRGHVQGLTVVGERKRAQSLANGQGAIEIVVG